MTPVNVGKNFDFIQKNLKFLFRASFKKRGLFTLEGLCSAAVKANRAHLLLVWSLPPTAVDKLLQRKHAVLIKQRTCLITGAVASA